MVQHAVRPDSRLRRQIGRAVGDGRIAHAIYSLALGSRDGVVPAKAAPTQLSLPGRAPPPPAPQPPSDEVLAIAHDLAVHLAFLGPHQADRACALMGPGTWRVVQRLGGWARLHRMPRLVQMTGLPVRVQRAVDQLGPRTRPRACARQRLTADLADRLVAHWRVQLPALGRPDAARLLSARLSLGSATLLLDRLAAAVADGAIPPERASAALGRLCDRCPAFG